MITDLDILTEGKVVFVALNKTVVASYECKNKMIWLEGIIEHLIDTQNLIGAFKTR